MRRLVGVLAAAALLAGCGQSGEKLGSPEAQSPGGGSAPSTGSGAWVAPSDYAFTFRSSCGERSGLGVFRVTVVDGTVVKAKPLGGSMRTRLSYVPSLAELVDIAAEAERKADEVTIRLADEGYPKVVDIDWIKDAIDDEACYFASQLVVAQA